MIKSLNKTRSLVYNKHINNKKSNRGLLIQLNKHKQNFNDEKKFIINIKYNICRTIIIWMQ